MTLFESKENVRHLESSLSAAFLTDLKNFYRIGAFSVSVDAIASDGLQDDLITIAIDKENSLADDKA